MTAFDKAWGVVKADGSPKNRINWGMHDTQKIQNLVDDSWYEDDSGNFEGRLSQIEAPEHPDGFVIPCRMCDEFDQTPEYCEGVKWYLDEGMEGLYTLCDQQLQRQIDERADDLHDPDMIEWIQRIEPAATNWPMVERYHNVTRTDE